MHAAGLEHLVTYPSQNRNRSPARRDIYQYMRLFWSSSRRKSNISGKVIPPDRSLSRSHAVVFFKCVSSFDVHILHLLILMRVLRKSWEQRETSAPRGMCSLLAKAVTAIVWAAWATVQSLLKRRWSTHTLSLEHCHSEVWLIYILIRASEKASKSLQCTI